MIAFPPALWVLEMTPGLRNNILEADSMLVDVTSTKRELERRGKSRAV